MTEELPKLPEGWARITIGESAVYQNGRAFKPSEWEQSGLPIIRIQNLNDENASFNYTTKSYEDKFLVKDGDLLFAWSASLGVFVWKRGDAWLNQHIFKVIPKEYIKKKFLYYTLKTLISQFYAKTHGSGMVHITKGKFEETEIPLPPLPEQSAIVEIIEEKLSSLDHAVEELKAAKERLGTYRQSVLKWAFEGKLTEEWREAHKEEMESAEELLERIRKERAERYERELEEWKRAVKKWEDGGKQGKKPAKPKKPKEVAPLTDEELRELPELPEGWAWEKLNLLTLGVEYGTSAKSKKTGKIPVLRMGNIQNFIFDWENLVFTDDEEEINKYILKKGDVLFNRTNSPELVGKTAIYRGERDAIFAGYLIRINQIKSIVNAYFLNYYLNSVFAKNYGNTVKTDGVNQSNISGSKLINYPFPFCPLPEQEIIVSEIERRLSVADKLDEAIDESLKKAEALRQSILKKAFEGELTRKWREEHPELITGENSAAALLERIRKEKEDSGKDKRRGRKRKATGGAV